MKVPDFCALDDLPIARSVEMKKKDIAQRWYCFADFAGVWNADCDAPRPRALIFDSCDN
jgi:hypothetical protein